MFKKLFLVIGLLAGAQGAAIAAHPFTSGPLGLLLTSLLEAPSASGAPEAAFPEMAAISFTAARVGEGALLTWDLPRTEAVSNLIIEGSEDGSHFIDLESLENTEAGVLDVYYDASPKARRYYRLIANYKDGRQKTTPINTLPPPAVLAAAIDPEEDTILSVSANGRVELYNMQGQLITVATGVQGKCAFGLQGLARGPYLVRAGAKRQVVIY